MHDRISVNNLCFAGTHWPPTSNSGALCRPTKSASIDEVKAEGWDQSVDLLRGSKFKIATIVHPFMLRNGLDRYDLIEASRKELSRTLAAAKTLGLDGLHGARADAGA